MKGTQRFSMERLLDVKQISEFLSVKPGTIYYWVSIGFIPHYKINKLVRFKEQEILEWLEKRKQDGRREQIPQVALEALSISKKS